MEIILNDEWLKFKRAEIEKVIKKYSPINFNNCISVRIDDSFYEYLYIGKEKQFHQVRILRHVLAPYVKDGVERGWFKGKNGEPLRWTGISNIFYLKGKDANKALEALLEALSTGKINQKYAIEVEENGEKFIGFCPEKMNNL